MPVRLGSYNSYRFNIVNMNIILMKGNNHVDQNLTNYLQTQINFAHTNGVFASHEFVYGINEMGTHLNFMMIS